MGLNSSFLPLSNSGTLDKSLNLPMPQSSHLKNRNNDSSCDDWMKWCMQCPTYTKLSVSTVNSWTTGGDGHQPLAHSALCILDSSVSVDSTNHTSYTMVGLIIEKNSCWPVHFNLGWLESNVLAIIMITRPFTWNKIWMYFHHLLIVFDIYCPYTMC